MADPLEIAAVTSFLLGEDSSYVTGETINCDGNSANVAEFVLENVEETCNLEGR